MDSKLTYLAGAITGLPEAEWRVWRERAKTLLKTEILDPTRREFESAKETVEGDLADIEQCDFVLVDGTRPSWGTAMEVLHAYWFDPTDGPIQIYAFTGELQELSPWLEHHTHRLFKTLEEACAAINHEAKNSSKKL